MKSIYDKDGFHQTMKKFVQNAEPDVMSLLKEEKRIMALVKSTGDYFHGNAKRDEDWQIDDFSSDDDNPYILFFSSGTRDLSTPTMPQYESLLPISLHLCSSESDNRCLGILVNEDNGIKYSFISNPRNGRWKSRRD
ncbi:hypothetical protein FXO38_05049 [Capsicum annuum]|nr:hypothetical protein FXO37_10026 [Capsicum annuum]KAF3674803.1 hypothetical protein FXO38_05049 [Capsicum annuum]